MAKLHVPPFHQRTVLTPPVRQDFPRSILTWDLVSVTGRGRIHFKPSRSFRSEEGGGVMEKKKSNIVRKNGLESKNDVNELMGAIRSTVWRFSKPSLRSEALEQLEKKLSSAAIQFARFIVTMMSTGAILLIGFQLSGGDSQMNALIWYSWLGGVIIGTMIGANMVLEEVSRAGPRNVAITGSTRGLGKALAREFFMSGDRVVVASCSPESIDRTIKELEDNLQQLLINSGDSSRKKLTRAKVVGIACDVSVPADVQKLANYAVKKLGSIDIWVNNAGTNKGFRPLLQFTDNDIQQIWVNKMWS